MKKILFFQLLISMAFSYSCHSDSKLNTVQLIEEKFTQLSTENKPWTFWYWISDNVSREGISKDLEAMSQAGIGAAAIGCIGMPDVEKGNVPTLSDQWWDMIQWAIKEGKRTGVEIGIFNCPGWSTSGGPWIKPEQSMRYLTLSEIAVKGPSEISQILEKPNESFQDVAVIAFQRPQSENQCLSRIKHKLKSSPEINNLQFLCDGNMNTEVIFPENAEQAVIFIKTEQPILANSLVLFPAEIFINAECQVFIRENGQYKHIKTFMVDRFNHDLNVGPYPYAPISVALGGLISDDFKLVFKLHKGRSMSGYVSGGIKELEITEALKLERYPEKFLLKMEQKDPTFNGKEYLWERQKVAAGKNLEINPTEVINISEKIDNKDYVNWDVPDGEWIIQRIGMTPTNIKISPVFPSAAGLEADKLDAKAVQYHFDSYIGKIWNSIPESDKGTFKYVIQDSWEAGSMNWTDTFRDEFMKAYGYDPIPWLPVLSGRVVGSVDQSDRFLWDCRRLVADLLADRYVAEMKKACDEKNLILFLENYCGFGFPGEALLYGKLADHLSGEFWIGAPYGNFECRIASSSAHIYGKKIISAESFTAGGMTFARTPAILKQRGDWSYTEGINHAVFHLFIHQPYEQKKPGINAPFGSEINRHNIWFSLSNYWIDYQRRCNYLLQQGDYVADICYFYGEDAPKLTGQLKPKPPKGYSFDFINYDVIMNYMDVEDGLFTLSSSGMKYKVMVLPEIETMRPELLKKISDLVKKGGIIIGNPPKYSPSMKKFPECDSELKALADQLWANVDGIKSKQQSFGKGKVFCNASLEEVFKNINYKPDVILNKDTSILWIHRALADMQIYFITNQTNNKISFNAGFRGTNMQPEWWNPIDGSVRALPEYQQSGTSITIPLTLEPYESGFVVFVKKARKTETKSNFPEFETVMKIDNPWVVDFTSPFNEHFVLNMNRLEDWSDSKNEQLKYFSGTAHYQTTFELEQLPENKIFIKLEDLSAIARISLNGKTAGGLWTPPFRIDVSELVKPGKNTLEIEVVSTWNNRLVKDQTLKEGERKTWLTFNPFKSDTPLVKSGLIGPVRIETIAE
jgi:hypothetical protein